MTAFTVGHTESYDQLIAGNDPHIKLGPTDNLHGKGQGYPGGIIFELPEDARKWLLKEGKSQIWSVYELAADFGTDSYKYAAEDFFRLTRDAEILRKVPVSE